MNSMPAHKIEWSRSIDTPWTKVESVRLGPPERSETPNQYVLLSRDGQPLLRIDACASSEESYAFRDAVVWHGFLVVGWGNSVYLIDIVSRTVTKHSVGSYFGHLYSTDEYLLVASAEHLCRIATNGSLAWKSESLGIDGVVVDEVANGVVRGQGEWDPPGGWRWFEIHLDSGRPTGAV